MTSTANDTTNQQPAEAPLTWTSSKVHGAVGMTHQASTEINGETWSFTVDSPQKGQWVARAWRDGDMALYREDRTMKGAKEQAQAHANDAATSTCTECRKIGGHKLDCGTGLAADMAKSAERGERIGLRAEVTEDAAPDVTGILPDGRPFVADMKTDSDRLAAYGRVQLAPDVLDQLDPAEAQQLMAELEETFPHLAEWKQRVLGERMTRVGQQLGQVAETIANDMTPAVVDAAESMRRMTAAIERVQAARDRVQLRKDTCGCRTPLHTMRCGVGGRARVIAKAGA
uniref:Uncharacterized protein n=1 Tax=Streptomyces phage Geonosis TaxID=3158856 RepID=A0AAU7GYN2_9CAUD